MDAAKKEIATYKNHFLPGRMEDSLAPVCTAVLVSCREETLKCKVTEVEYMCLQAIRKKPASLQRRLRDYTADLSNLARQDRKDWKEPMHSDVVAVIAGYLAVGESDGKRKKQTDADADDGDSDNDKGDRTKEKDKKKKDKDGGKDHNKKKKTKVKA